MKIKTPRLHPKGKILLALEGIKSECKLVPKNALQLMDFWLLHPKITLYYWTKEDLGANPVFHKAIAVF